MTKKELQQKSKFDKYIEKLGDLPKKEIAYIRDENILALKSRGWTYQEISEYVGVTRQRVQQITRSSGFIYIFRCRGFYKIGLSGKPMERLKSLRIGNPYPISIIAIYPVLRRDNTMIKAEQYLHSKFADKRTTGEWFRLRKEDVKEIGVYLNYKNKLSTDRG